MTETVDGRPQRSISPTGLADLATAVWRLQSRLTDGPDHRYVRAVADALTELGVATRDYDGMPFDSGLKVRVLAFQPTDGLHREEVVETIRPAVYLQDAPVQIGEVIVGVPKTTDTAEE